MRLSEAFEIDGEETERGCRYVIVGKKTEQSLRRVPLPAAVLPFVPKAIKGPLFASNDADPSDAASKRLNRFLDDCGITDPRKVVHSLRHRAQDRLRAAGCPEDVRWALLGHEEKTVAAGYGKGFRCRCSSAGSTKLAFDLAPAFRWRGVRSTRTRLISRNRWPSDAGLRIDHLLLSKEAAKRFRCRRRRSRGARQRKRQRSCLGLDRVVWRLPLIPANCFARGGEANNHPTKRSRREAISKAVCNHIRPPAALGDRRRLVRASRLSRAAEEHPQKGSPESTTFS